MRQFMQNLRRFLSPVLESGSLPFLFLGSGISIRYLGLPSWNGLLYQLAEKIYRDPKMRYAQIKQIISKETSEKENFNEFMTRIADIIEDDLTQIWYDSSKFEQSRKDFGHYAIENSVSPLKIEIAKLIKDNSHVNEHYRKEVDLMKSLSSHSISGIITTNYDLFLNEVFNEYTIYNSQDMLLFSENMQILDLYKIHGCISNPSTIMVNTKDYDRIKQRDKYLAAKLMTIFIEHPIIFMGYSLNDEDIHSILNNIVICLDEEQRAKLQNRIVFVQYKAGEYNFKTSVSSIAFKDNSIIDFNKVETDNFEGLFELLKENKSKYPLKQMKKIKKDIYNLVLTNEKSDKMKVLINPESVNDKDIEYVMGFGVEDLAKRGCAQPMNDEIYKDIILDDGEFIADMLLEYTLDQSEKIYGEAPIFKYLSTADKKFSHKYKERIKKYSTIDSFKNKSEKNRTLTNKLTSKEIIESKYNVYHKLNDMLGVDENDLNTKDIHTLLFDIFTLCPGILNNKPISRDCVFPELLNMNKTPKPMVKTNIRKLTKIYDFLVYKK